MSEVWSPDPTGWLFHDWCGERTLYAYPYEEVRTLPEGVAIYHPQYGRKADTRLRTHYCGVWRDSAKYSTRDRNLGWPSEISLHCAFGEGPQEVSTNLQDILAWQANHEDGKLYLAWEWQDDGYRPIEFRLELRRNGSPTHFHSLHDRQTIDELDLEIDPIAVPQECEQLSFRIAGQVRKKMGSREPATGPAIRFSAMGTVSHGGLA